MSDQYSGLPATVIANLPTAKNIQSTTNASPIVVTATTTHNIRTGDYVYVTGATDPNANGIWPVGTVTSNTLVLTGTTGTLVGGAAGTVLDLGFGPSFPVPAGNDPYHSDTYAPGYQALGDRTAWLIYAIRYAMILKKGGSTSADDGHSFAGYWDLGGATLLGLPTRLIDNVPTLLSDTDQTIGISGGRRYRLSEGPAAIRTISIAKTGANTPRTGDTIEILVRKGLATGHQYNVKRSGSANNICQFFGADEGNVGIWCRFFYDLDNEWHLDANSGGGVSDVTTNPAKSSGVLSGLDA